MSHEGKMKRGKAYYGMRDLNGNYSEWITNNESIMLDLNYFLENSKLKEEAKNKVKEKK